MTGALQRGARVKVVVHDWDLGTIELEGTVVRRLSDLYFEVEADKEYRGRRLIVAQVSALLEGGS